MPHICRRSRPNLLDYFVESPMIAEAVEDASTVFKKTLIEWVKTGEGAVVQQGGVFGFGDAVRRFARHSESVDRDRRGGQILDEGLNDLTTRGFEDILIMVANGLTGVLQAPEALVVLPTRLTDPSAEVFSLRV